MVLWFLRCVQKVKRKCNLNLIYAVQELNGQLLHSGTTSQVNAGDRDYYVVPPSSLTFSFETRIDDVLDVIVYSIPP